MADYSRKDRIASMIKREVATCISQEIRDPRIGFLTVTRVEVDEDLSTATAYYTILGSQGSAKLAQQALKRARGFIQNSYAKVIRTRQLPVLKFIYDEEEKRRMEMDDLIRQARESDPNSEPETPNEAP